MTLQEPINSYFQGPQRAVIQVERKERGDWIAWNWNYCRWDRVTAKLSANGERTTADQEGK